MCIRDRLRAVTRFQYQLNKSTWVDGEINSKEIAGTAVVVYVCLLYTSSPYYFATVQMDVTCPSMSSENNPEIEVLI